MNHNVYLPDPISERAKAAGLNLSGLLRTAVIDELDRQEALAEAQDGMTLQTVDIEGEVGDAPRRLRFTGKHISSGDGLGVYLTNEGKVILADDEDYTVFDDVEEFSTWVADERRDNLGQHQEEVITDAVAGVGGREVIDL